MLEMPVVPNTVSSNPTPTESSLCKTAHIPTKIYNTATWPDPHFQFLKECWASGMSAERSAISLNQKFGTTYSRNAVIGKVNRHGLSAVFGRVRAHGAVRRPRNIRRVRLPNFPIFVPATPPLMPVDPLNILFSDLAQHHCREIVGKDGWETLSCGHDKYQFIDRMGGRAVSSYCRYHHAVNHWRR